MADGEASGEARLDDPVDEPVDTDPLAVTRSDDYPDDPQPHVEWVEPPPPTEAEEQTFDAFDSRTWNFRAAPTPWYRTGPTAVVVVAVSVAAVALVVSVVLLAFRGTSGEQTAPSDETSSAPSSPSAPTTTSDEPLSPPPPLPPPPPPPPSASEIERAPVIVRQPSRPTKKPEQNVTRSPMSVSPQKPSR